MSGRAFFGNRIDPKGSGAEPARSGRQGALAAGADPSGARPLRAGPGAGDGGGSVPAAPNRAGRPRIAVKCLLIDDSKYDRQRLLRIAEQTRLDVSFTEVSNLDDAITALRRGNFDLILLDQSLPDGDGTTVAGLLNTHLGNQAPPIIMVSGSIEAAMPARAFASGCADYISKDDLNIPGLEKAILGTVAKAEPEPLRTSVSMEEYRAALRSFAEDTTLELRIPLSRMLRMLPSIADRHPAANQDVAELTAICHEMWRYLDFVCAPEPS